MKKRQEHLRPIRGLIVWIVFLKTSSDENSGAYEGSPRARWMTSGEWYASRKAAEDSVVGWEGNWTIAKLSLLSGLVGGVDVAG